VSLYNLVEHFSSWWEWINCHQTHSEHWSSYSLTYLLTYKRTAILHSSRQNGMIQRYITYVTWQWLNLKVKVADDSAYMLVLLVLMRKKVWFLYFLSRNIHDWNSNCRPICQYGVAINRQCHPDFGCWCCNALYRTTAQLHWENLPSFYLQTSNLFDSMPVIIYQYCF